MLSKRLVVYISFSLVVLTILQFVIFQNAIRGNLLVIKDEKVKSNSIDDDVYSDHDIKHLEHDDVTTLLEQMNQEDVNGPFKISYNKDEILERNDDEEKEKNVTKVKLRQTLTSGEMNKNASNTTNATDKFTNKSFAIR